jgi:hypothetical protein
MTQHHPRLAKWTFGVNVAICLMVLIGVMVWRLLALPADDNGGGMMGAMVVSAIEFVRNLLVIEVVRRVFRWKLGGG